MTEEQLRKVKNLRERFPQVDLQSARKAVEEGVFILYGCEGWLDKFWSHEAAVKNFAPLQQLKWYLIPYKEGIEMLEKEELEELFS